MTTENEKNNRQRTSGMRWQTNGEIKRRAEKSERIAKCTNCTIERCEHSVCANIHGLQHVNMYITCSSALLSPNWCDIIAAAVRIYCQPYIWTACAHCSCIKLNLSFMRNTLSCKFEYEFMHIAFANTFIFNIHTCKHNAVRVPCAVRWTSLLDGKMICGDAHCRYLSINEWPQIHDVRYRCQRIYIPSALRPIRQPLTTAL